MIEAYVVNDAASLKKLKVVFSDTVSGQSVKRWCSVEGVFWDRLEIPKIAITNTRELVGFRNAQVSCKISKESVPLLESKAALI